MFFRIKKSGPREYLQIVENRWEDGRSKQRVLITLGRADVLRESNRATLAWVERGYHRSTHSETKQEPLERWLDGPSVGRPPPTLEDLRFAFTTSQTRTQRRSDGTISLAGQRFEIPDRFRHMHRITLRFASWDLRWVWIVDDHTGVVLDRCTPLDRTRNADRFRKPRHSAGEQIPETTEPAGTAPLLERLMQEYAATGLPPAYLPTEES